MSVTSNGTVIETQTNSNATLASAWGSGQNRNAGELLVLIVGIEVNSTTLPGITTPAGWSLIGSVAKAGASDASRVSMFFKVAAGSDAAPSVTVSSSTGNGETVLYDLSGADTSAPPQTFGTQSGAAVTNITTTTSGNVSTAGSFAISASAMVSGSNSTYTVGTGWTNDINPASGKKMMATDHQSNPSTGATLSELQTWSSSTDDVVGFISVFAPSASTPIAVPTTTARRRQARAPRGSITGSNAPPPIISVGWTRTSRKVTPPRSRSSFRPNSAPPRTVVVAWIRSAQRRNALRRGLAFRSGNQPLPAPVITAAFLQAEPRRTPRTPRRGGFAQAAPQQPIVAFQLRSARRPVWVARRGRFLIGIVPPTAAPIAPIAVSQLHASRRPQPLARRKGFSTGILPPVTVVITPVVPSWLRAKSPPQRPRRGRSWIAGMLNRFGRLALHLSGTEADANAFGGTETTVDLVLAGTVNDSNLYGGMQADANLYGGTEADANLYGGTETDNNAFGGTEVDTNLLGGSDVAWTMQPINLTLAEFNDETLNVAITSNGVAYNLTGVTVQALFKTAAGVLDSDASTITLSTATSGVTITNAAGGLATVTLPHADLLNTNIKFWRLDVIVGGLINTVFYGTVSVTPL